VITERKKTNAPIYPEFNFHSPWHTFCSQLFIQGVKSDYIGATRGHRLLLQLHHSSDNPIAQLNRTNDQQNMNNVPSDIFPTAFYLKEQAAACSFIVIKSTT